METYFILKGSNNFNSVAVSRTASLNAGCVYTTASGNLNVLQLSDNTLNDHYSLNVLGRTSEFLKCDDTVDITVG